ncbi:MAG: sulfatase [Treponema sp.]|nr:sulfatase [Treponema sp.]
MKAIMMMFDSLNRNFLSAYGCDWTKTPNFKRLADKAVVFDNCWAGSLPCMPARRELHTGRYNFLHRSWGPVEPFDDSMPEILQRAGVYTRLISDHQHYWEDGGATYHHRYNTWETVRGQEADQWKGQVRKPVIPPHLGQLGPQEVINRSYMTKEEDQPQANVFRLGLEFLEQNKNEDNWFLHLETFDPHEPFYSMQKYKDLYPHEYNGPQFDWPPYSKVTEGKEAVQHVRYEYAALLSMCDAWLGRLLDFMDANDMWKDTLLIVNTDHGFLLGEHDCWAKCFHPFYNEIAHTPFFVWDPRTGIKGQRRQSLVQTIDIAPTLLDYFNVGVPPDMQGRPLKDVIKSDKPIREGALYGLFGAQINVTDGRYVYMRDPVPSNKPLYEYTHMPTHMRTFFSLKEMGTMAIAPPFAFTKGVPVMKIEALAGFLSGTAAPQFGTKLFDLQNDPGQENPINDKAAEERMIRLMVKLMKENDCPPEQFERMGLRDS